MKVLSISFILSLALILGFCYASELPVESVPSGLYITTKLDFLDVYTAFEKLKTVCGNNFTCGDMIVQAEKRHPEIGNLKWNYVFSQQISNVDTSHLPIPNDPTIKLDFHYNSKKKVSQKFFSEPVPVGQVYQKVIEVHNETQTPLQRNWFYMTGLKGLETTHPTFSKLWFDKPPPFTRRTFPPDDSNIPRLCSGKSGYNCPNTTYCLKDNIETRNMSMYIVTGEARDNPEKNCSFGSVVYTQYMNNFRYFLGQNSLHVKMNRTIPVMIKVTKNTFPRDCPFKFQTQFYVHRNPPPCPTNANVRLEELTGMEVYVKAFYGNADSDMEFLYEHFSRELISQTLSHVYGRYYLSVFRGHGPAFGRRLEIWVLKKPLACSRQRCS